MVPKVFIAIGSLSRGGSERQVVEFVRSAHPRHADCTVVCLLDEGPLAPDVRAIGARVVPLGFRRPRWFQALAKLVRLLRSERPDVIYALLFDAYCIVLPVARVAFPRATRIAGRRSLSRYDVSTMPGARRLRFVADRCSDRVIANSRAVAADWEAENPRLHGRVDVVPNGVRLPEVEAAAPDPEGRLRIVCVANLIDYKGHRVLVEALARLAGRDDWRADLVGDGAERDALTAQLRGAGLDGRVTLHGALPQVDALALVKGSDVSVLPSFTEGLPNAVMEAMALGVPVVATDVGGVRDLLENGAGIVVPPHEAQPLADALAAMLDDPARRAAAGEQGAREIAATYSVESMRDRTLSVLEAARAAR